MPIRNLLTVEGSGFIVDAEYFADMVERGLGAENEALDTEIWFEGEKVFVRFVTRDFPSIDEALSRMSETWPGFSFTLESNAGNADPAQRRIASRAAYSN